MADDIHALKEKMEKKLATVMTDERAGVIAEAIREFVDGALSEFEDKIKGRGVWSRDY